MKRKTKTYKEWAPWVAKQLASGLTIAEFARQNDLNLGKLVYWVARSKKLNRESAKKPREYQESSNEFVELGQPNLLADLPQGKMLRITTSYGCTIEVPL